MSDDTKCTRCGVGGEPLFASVCNDCSRELETEPHLPEDPRRALDTRRIGKLTMTRDCGQLFKAIAKAQAKIGPALRNAKGQSVDGEREWEYADLAAVIQAAAPLHKYAVAVVQQPVAGHEGPAVMTTLGHESGQFITGTLELSSRPHDDGAAITYARRYALSGVANIPQADDDAQSLQARGTPPVSAADELAAQREGMLEGYKIELSLMTSVHDLNAWNAKNSKMSASLRIALTDYIQKVRDRLEQDDTTNQPSGG